MTSHDRTPRTKHATLYASFMIVPFALGVVIAIGVLLYVAAEQGWWWAFWTLIGVEVYTVITVIGVRRHTRRQRQSGPYVEEHTPCE